MKRNTLLLFICLFTAASCNRGQVLRISGYVDNPAFEGSKAYIVGSSIREDSAVIRNSSFTFAVPADSMAVKSIVIPPKGEHGIQDLIFIGEPGTLEVSMSVKSHSSGTRLNTLLMKWQQENFLYDSIQNDLYYRSGIPGITHERYDSIMKLSAQIDSSYIWRNIEIMNQNLENGIGLFFFKFYYEHLPKEVKVSVLEKAGGLFLKADKQVLSRVMFDPEIPKENLLAK